MTAKNRATALETIDKLLKQVEENAKGKSTDAHIYLSAFHILLNDVKNKVSGNTDISNLKEIKSQSIASLMGRLLYVFTYCQVKNDLIDVEEAKTILLTEEVTKTYRDLEHALLDNKGILQERFMALFRDCKLACIHLDGFSHDVFYITKEGKRAKIEYSAYCDKDEKLEKLFQGFSHAFYKHNAKEYVYMSPKKFKSFAL